MLHRSCRPAALFTTPPLAVVGLREEGAREQCLRFGANYAYASGWHSSRRVPEKHSGYKVVIEEGTDRILGAHLLGSKLDQWVNAVAWAIRSGITATALKETLFVDPTHGSDIASMLA